DLDLGRRNLLQVRQRRVALAEVVDREVDAELADALDARERRLVALHQAVLGDLDREPEAPFVEVALELLEPRDEFRVAEHARRDVDGDRERLRQRRPFLHALRDLIEHEPGDRDDAAGRLGQRDEVARRDEAAGLRAPAHERFYAADAARLDLDLRLEVDLEL